MRFQPAAQQAEGRVATGLCGWVQAAPQDELAGLDDLGACGLELVDRPDRALVRSERRRALPRRAPVDDLDLFRLLG
jgi:hypothetical protein